MTATLTPELDRPGDAVEVARPVASHLGSGGTTRLVRPDAALGPQVRRAVGKMSRRDILTILGAVASSLCTTLLLFGRLTPLSGRFGFVVVWFLVFLVTYALLVSLDNPVPIVVDRVMATLMTAAAFVSFVALCSVVLFTFGKGWRALVRPNTYTQDMSSAGPAEPLSVGGISHAIVGTLIIISIALVITVPLGLACAVFLNETKGRFTNAVRTIVTAMTALPSILAGLFIFAVWVQILGFQRSGFAAAMAVSIMMIPIITRSADVVLRLVPGSLREASAATGAPQWRTVWFVVLPTARSGLATSVILGMARGVGETAPVLLTSGIVKSMNTDPFNNGMMSLPLATFDFVRSGQQNLVQRGFATAAVLMMVVLVLFTIARIIGGKPAGQLSKRQLRRALARSAKDRARIEATLHEVTR